MELVITGIFTFGIILYILDGVFNWGIFDKLDKLTNNAF